MRLSTILLFAFILAISCANENNQSISVKESFEVSNSDTIELLLKKMYPRMGEKIEYEKNTNLNCINVDTAGAYEFIGVRPYIGHIKQITITFQKENLSKRICASSGTLKLYIYNLPFEVFNRNKIIVSGYVFDQWGSEKVCGLPFVMTNYCISE